MSIRDDIITATDAINGLTSVLGDHRLSLEDNTAATNLLNQALGDYVTRMESVASAMGQMMQNAPAPAPAQAIAAQTVSGQPIILNVANLNTSLQTTAQQLAQFRDSLTRSPIDLISERIASGFGLDFKGTQIVMGRWTSIISDTMEMAAEGIKKAAALSVTAQQGVALEFSRQYNSIRSLLTLDPNRAVTAEQLYDAQQAVVNALGGLRSGLTYDTKGITDTVIAFRSGLNSQIVPTAESFRTLAALGIRPTTDALTQLREATGRESIGQSQMDVLNRNRTALQIFGMQLAKTALDFERVGISLNSVMAGGEQFVTNLEGGLDAIAQLNQLGANLDFGRLTMLNEVDPAQVPQYLAQAIPESLLRLSSGKALVGQLPGANVQDILAIQQGEALGRTLEEATTKAKNNSDATEMATGAMAYVSQASRILGGSFASLSIEAVATTIAMGRLTYAIQANTAAQTQQAAQSRFNMNSLAMTPLRGAVGGAVTGLAVGGMDAYDSYKRGDSNTEVAVRGLAPVIGGAVGAAAGVKLGTTLGATLGTFLAPGVGTAVGGLLGGLVGGGLGIAGARMGANALMDDGISLPESGRVLTTDEGSFAINPSDTVLAGTDLFRNLSSPSESSREAESAILRQVAAQSQNVQLIQKIEDLITALKSANVVIETDSGRESVNRLAVQMVRVLPRDETTRTL